VIEGNLLLAMAGKFGDVVGYCIVEAELAALHQIPDGG
jgi:hypothetical protein